MSTTATEDPIDLAPEDLVALLERIEPQVDPADFACIRALARTVLDVFELAQRQKATIRDLRALLNPTNEGLANLTGQQAGSDEGSEDGEVDASDDAPKGADDTPASSADSTDSDAAIVATATDAAVATDTDAADRDTDTDASAHKPRRRGHGRTPASSYTGATVVTITHEDLTAKNLCPSCKQGKVYFNRWIQRVRITGAQPFSATAYKLEQLRCNLCGALFTADAPPELEPEIYAPSVSVMLILLHYALGMPFARLATLQAAMGVPLPASMQWQLIDRVVPLVQPVIDYLRSLAADAAIIYADDTRGQILEITAEKKERARLAAAGTLPDSTDPPDPLADRAVHTTGIVACVAHHLIVLYDTGQRIAGENLDRLLTQRDPALAPPILMADALAHNNPNKASVQRASCMVHGRRQFVVIFENHPDECLHVIQTIATVYHHDAESKRAGHSAEERHQHHLTYSKPLLDALAAWADRCIADRLVEPNADLGKAITYLRKHWDKLTLFLTVPGAPLDNNLCERALKKIILQRKNSLFFKTRKGARVANDLTGLIHTCELNGVNPHRYLEALLAHPEACEDTPDQWLPWNFESALAATDTPTDGSEPQSFLN